MKMMKSRVFHRIHAHGNYYYILIEAKIFMFCLYLEFLLVTLTVISD